MKEEKGKKEEKKRRDGNRLIKLNYILSTNVAGM